MAADPRLELLVRRPEISYRVATLRSAAWAAAGALLGILCRLVVMYATGDGSGRAAPFGNSIVAASLGILVALVLRAGHIMVFCIRIYQRHADAETRLRCRQIPTCSEYAILAIQRYGPVRGAWKSVGRLRRCRPPGRIDYP
jgi:putative membrane protein insertion efficiency factor